jgi:hypothetical protein
MSIPSPGVGIPTFGMGFIIWYGFTIT